MRVKEMPEDAEEKRFLTSPKAVGTTICSDGLKVPERPPWSAPNSKPSFESRTTDEPVCRAGVEMETEDRVVTGRERRGWDGLREQHWHIHTAVCERDSSGEAAVWGGAFSSALCEGLAE